MKPVSPEPKEPEIINLKTSDDEGPENMDKALLEDSEEESPRPNYLEN